MREVILKRGNRSFLDLFWNITSTENDKRNAAIKQLQNHLSVQRNDIQKHISYTLDRLCKGLRSSSSSSKSGFVEALIAILQNNKSITTEALLLSLDRHVLSFKAEDSKERSATNLAKADCLYILYKSGRLADLKQGDHQKIVTSLTSLLSSEPCLNSIQSVLSEVAPHIDKKFISTYGALISEIWNTAWKSDEPSAGQLLFIIRLQEHKEVISIINKPRVFRTADKSMVKLISSAVKRCLHNSQFEEAGALVSQFKTSVIFHKLWTRLSVPIEKTETPVNQRIQALKLGLVLLPDLTTETQFKVVVTPALLAFLQKQLSSAKLSSHGEIVRLVNQLIASWKAPTSPNVAAQIFTTIADQMPLFDVNLAPKTPRLLSILMEIASPALTEAYLHELTQKLQALFLSTKEVEDSSGPTVDKQRIHILEMLRQVVFILVTRATLNCEFLHESLDFLLLVANATAVPLEAAQGAVVPSVSEAALTQLGRCLTLLINRVSLRTEMKETTQLVKTCKQAFEVLVGTLRHLLETELKLCTGGMGAESANELVQRLERVKEMLGDTGSGGDCDVGLWIGVLYTVTAIYTVTLHTDPPSPKEASLLGLLDDISASHSHRATTSTAMETEEEVESGAPEWSAVLTDAMLSLCVEPWRLLRVAVSATFSRIVAKGELFTGPPKVASAASLFEEKVTREEEEGESQEQESPLDLILSIADTRSKAAQERIGVAGEEEEDGSDEDDEEADHDQADGESSDDEKVEDDEEELGGFDKLDGVEDLPEEVEEEEGESGGEEEEGEEEFLTDEQMQAQDAALAALVKASRSFKTDAKTRKKTIALLKLRSFDFLECLLMYSTDAQVFLRTLHVVLRLAVHSSRRASRFEQEKQKRQTDKEGCVSLARVGATLDQLRLRPPTTNQQLVQSINQSGHEVLLACLKSCFSLSKHAIPDAKLLKCLEVVCEFLQFKKVEGNEGCVKTLAEALQLFVAQSLASNHPTKMHELLLKRFIASAPDLVPSISEDLLAQLKAARCKSGETYKQTVILSLASAVTNSLAATKTSSMSTWAQMLARELTEGYFVPKGAWLQSKSLASAVFDCLFQCIRADKSVVDALEKGQLKALLTLDRTLVPKAARKHHSRLTQLILSLRNSSERLAGVLSKLGEARRRQKEEAKQARRAKRKAKQAADAATAKKPADKRAKVADE